MNDLPHALPRYLRRCALQLLLCCLLTPLLPAQEAAESASNAAYLRDIEALLQDNVYNEAIRRLEAWLRENPDDVEARRLICRAYEETEDAFRLRFHARILSEALPEDGQVQSWLETAEATIEEEYPAKVEELETALANDPENRNLRRDLINLYLLGERVDDAIREFKVLLGQDPDNPELLLEYARNLAWMDQLEESLTAYQRYIDLVEDPSNAIWLELARVHAWNVEYREAVSILNDILDREPDNLDARVLLGDIYRWNDDSVAAESYYTFALERDPEHPEALAGMRALEELERIRTQASGTLSIPEMERRVEENPDDAGAVKQLARLYAANNDYASAAETYERYFELRPDDVPVLRDYAFCLSMEQRYDESIVALRRYLEDYPEDIPVRLDVVNMLMWSERYEQARQELFAIKDFADLYPEITWKLARIEHIRGNFPEAIDFYEQLDDTAPQFNVAQAYIREIESRPSYQLAQLEQRVAEDPEDIESRLELATIYLDAERYWEARSQAEDVLQLDPENVEAERIIGWADVGLEELRFERLRQLRARLRENPNDAEAALEIARILRIEQNYEDAIRFYRTYLSQFPEDDAVLEEYAMTLYWMPGREMVAAEELGRLLQFRPDDIELHIRYLELLARNDSLTVEDYETMAAIEAELDYRMLLDPDNPQHYFWFGRLSQVRDNVETALEFYYYADSLLPRGAAMRRTIQQRIDGLENSPNHQMRSLTEYVREYPNDTEALLELAFMQYDFESYYEARDTAQRVMDIDPNNLEARNLYRAADRLIVDIRANRLESLRVEVMENPRNMEAQLELAQLLRQRGAYAEARERYRMYLRAYPSDMEVRREYAEMLSWSDEHRDEAVEELRQLAEMYPHDYEFQLQVARVMSWDRRYWDEAEERLERLSRLMGEDPEIMIIQADLHRYRGRLNEAQELYDQVLAMTGHTPDYYSRRYVGSRPVAPYGRDDRYNDGRMDEPLPPIATNPDGSLITGDDSGFSRMDRDPRSGRGVYDRDGVRLRDTSEASRYRDSQTVVEDRYLPPLYYRDPSVYASRERFDAPEDRAFARPRTMVQYEAQRVREPARTERFRTGPARSNDPREFDGTDFRARTEGSVEGGRRDFGTGESLEIIPTERREMPVREQREPVPEFRERERQIREIREVREPVRQVREFREPTREPGRPEYEYQSAPQPRRVSDARSLVMERRDIPEVRRSDLNRMVRDSDPISYRRRPLASPGSANGREPTYMARSDVDPRYSRMASADREGDFERRPLREAPRPGERARPVRETERSREDEPVYRRPRFEGRYVQDPLEYRRENGRRLPVERQQYAQADPVPPAREPIPRERVTRPDPRLIEDPRRYEPVYRTAPRMAPRVDPRSDTDALYGNRPFYPAGDDRRFVPAPQRQAPVPRRYREPVPERRMPNYREAPAYPIERRYDPVRDPVRDPRDMRRNDAFDYEDPRYRPRRDPRIDDPRYNRGSLEPPLRMRPERSREVFVPPVGDRLYDREFGRLAYDPRAGDARRSRPVATRRDRDPFGGQVRGPVLNPLRDQRRFYGPREPVRQSEPRPVVAPAPVIAERPERPRIDLLPVENLSGFRQIGDTRRARVRVEPRGEPVAVDPANLDYASRAEAGMRSIDEQLRPRIGLFYGIEGDSDDFFGQRFGGRYSHFLRGGTRWDAGLTYYSYEEDSGLSINDQIDALMLTLGISAPIGERLSGSAELKLTDFSIEPDLTLTGGVGASYAVNPVNTLSFDYDNYDIIHNVKTVRSLEEEIYADRVRLSWNSNPVGDVMNRAFWERVFFEGNISYASYSDTNTEVAYVIRPYYRISDEPTLDFTAGFRGLSYDFDSPFYWSPDSYSGPLFGLRLSGQTVWDLLYDIRGEIFLPSSSETSRSLSIDLRKAFTENFSAGGNLFMTQSPREDDASYSYYGVLLDMLYRF